jgi:hypothetical protein
VIWDTTNDTIKKKRKSDCPYHPKPTNYACKIGYNNATVAYKLDNALVAKYPTSDERQATSSNDGKVSVNEEDAHYGKASAGGNGHDTLGNKASARGRPTTNSYESLATMARSIAAGQTIASRA